MASPSRVLLLALVLLLGVAAQAQQTVSFTYNFTGGLPFCSQCGSPGQYACSPDSNGQTLGNWNSGSVSFADPIPSGNYATRLEVIVTGAFSCNAVGGRAMFGAVLNGNTHAVRDTRKGVNACKCDTCDGTEVFTITQRNGISGYRYRSSNTLQLALFEDSICVNKVEVKISYEPVTSSPPAPLPEYFLPMTIPQNYDRVGCSVCNKDLNQWCSASGNNTLTLSFKDPLPTKVYLVSIDAYVSYNMIQKHYYQYTTMTLTVQDTLVGSFSINDASWIDKCGCYSDATMQSALYQRGWPGYIVGGVNKLNLSIKKYSESSGNVCVGRLNLKLVYYELTEAQDAPVLKSLVVEADAE